MPTTNEDYRAMLAERDEALESLRTLRRDMDRILTPPPPRLLLVDDDIGSLDALAYDFEELSGLEIVRCTNPEHACELLETQDFAGVVLDLHLAHPEVNGARLAEMVPRQRILAMVSADPDLPALARQLGAHWLGKPYTTREPRLSTLHGDLRPTPVFGTPAADEDLELPPPESSVERVCRDVLALLRRSFS